MVLSWIRNFISNNLISSVIQLETRQQVGEDLKERYALSNSIQISQIKCIILIHVEEQLPIASLVYHS